MDNKYLFNNELKKGVYAVRILKVYRTFKKQLEYFNIDVEVIVDLSGWCYYREEKTISLSLKDNLYRIKKFIDVAAPLIRTYEAIYTTTVKQTAAIDSIIGVIVKDKNCISFYNINEYRYSEFNYSDNVLPF